MGVIYSSSDRDYSKSLETAKHRRPGLEGGEMVELQDNIYGIYTLTLDPELYTSLFYIAGCWDCVNWKVGQTKRTKWWVEHFTADYFLCICSTDPPVRELNSCCFNDTY